MDIKFNSYGRAESAIAYIAKPSGEQLGVLNGIQNNTGKCERGISTSTLSFTVDKYIDGETSNYYDFIEKPMHVIITGVGEFIIDDVTVNNQDGKNETKDVSLVSKDQEFVQHDLVGFKVNNGTTDSCEMLIDGNVEIIDGVEFAKKQITFHNSEDDRFSLIQTVLNWAGMTDWTIGYIDPVPKEFTVYQNGEYVKKTYTLSEQVGYFNIDSENAYDFFVKDASQYFECVFVFNILKKEISAYYAEHIGKDTNIVIGWRNLQKSNVITQDQNLYTRYTVQGGDDLSIYFANFGSNMIENISYFLNEKYMPASLIKKYKAWKTDVESKRNNYMSLTVQYNDNLDTISELQNRVPLDGCSDDFSKFSEDELKAAKDGYDAQILGYESFYIDDDGNFDIEALKACESDWNEYCQIKDVILPNIQIEYDNRELPTSVGEMDYLDSYKTDWKLYGVDELKAKILSYQDQKKLLEADHYDIPYATYYELSTEEVNNGIADGDRKYSGHTQVVHEQQYALYLDTIYQLSESYMDSCASTLLHRENEVATLENNNKDIQAQRNEILVSFDKNTWELEGYDKFTQSELSILSKIYNDTDYTNENVIVVDNDTNSSTVNEQLRLYELAENDLSIYSQPQYIYSTEVDTFLSNPDYKNYIRDLNICNFIRIETTPGTFVKLRCVSIGFNPFIPNDTNFTIGFSNMLRSASGRNDVNYLFDNAGGGSKNSITGSSGSTNNSTETVQLTPGLLRKLFSNSSFKNEVSNITDAQFNTLIGKYIKLDTVDAELVRAIDVKADNGFFNYIQTELISAGKIVANSGEFKDLDALVAKIKDAIIGTSTTETGIIIRLTSENATIDEAFIRNIIASYISVSDLKSGNIDTNKFNVISANGNMSIIGNTQTFKDSNGVTRIQIGEDANGNFTFTLYDATGNGILLDSTGVKASAISDGLIKNDMIADNTIGKEKFNFEIMETDANGNIDIGHVTVDGEGLDIKFSSLSNAITTISEDIESLQTSSSAIEAKVDANTRSIAAKATQTDITNAINSYDGSTVKEVRDRVTGIELDVSGVKTSVSDIETLVETKADGTTVTALTDRVASAEQTAAGFKTEVESNYVTKDSLSTVSQKADKIESDVTTKYSTTEQMQSAILQMSNSIKTTVSDTYATKNSLSEVEQTASGIGIRVDDAEGNIANLQISASELHTEVFGEDEKSGLSQRMDNIGAHVESSDGRIAQIELESSGYATKIEMDNATTSLRQEATFFEQSVVQNYATKELLDKISIGGRNLLINSNKLSEVHWENISGSATIGADGYYEVLYNGNGWCGARQSVKLEAGVEYTLSGWCKGSDPRLYIYSSSNEYGTSAVGNITDGKLLAVTATIKNTGYYYVICYATSTTINYYKNIKLERGNKATDWSPAPEDYDLEFSSLKQSASGLQLSMTKIGAFNKSDVDTSGWTEEEKKALDTLEVNIDMNADGITVSNTSNEETATQKTVLDTDSLRGQYAEYLQVGSTVYVKGKGSGVVMTVDGQLYTVKFSDNSTMVIDKWRDAFSINEDRVYVARLEVNDGIQIGVEDSNNKATTKILPFYSSSTNGVIFVNGSGES